jgi:hypothetical protein
VEQPPSAVLYAGEGAGSTFSSKFEISGIFARASFGNRYSFVKASMNHKGKSSSWPMNST